MLVPAFAAGSGLAFGFLISLGRPQRSRSPFLGLRALRGSGFRALVTGDLVAWTTAPPRRRHVVGSLIFGGGWAVADACPGPIAAQIGFGSVWSLCTAAGVVAGIALYLRREETRAAAPPAAAAEAASA